MSAAEVLVHREGPAVEIALHRPTRRNALSVAMYAALADALEAAAEDPGARCVLLRGEGGAFTSGNDLLDFMQSPPTGTDSPVFRFLSALVGFPKPLVAAVEGHAIGIGTTMLLHCDLVYASETARFQLPFVNLALVPEAAATFLLPRSLGHARAAELLFFGDPFEPRTARALGIVNDVFAPDRLLPEARARVARLCEKPPSALRETKRLMKAAISGDAAAHILVEAASFLERLGTAEVAEAVTAFFEKRKPDFSRFE